MCYDYTITQLHDYTNRQHSSGLRGIPQYTSIYPPPFLHFSFPAIFLQWFILSYPRGGALDPNSISGIFSIGEGIPREAYEVFSVRARLAFQRPRMRCGIHFGGISKKVFIPGTCFHLSFTAAGGQEAPGFFISFKGVQPSAPTVAPE